MIDPKELTKELFLEHKYIISDSLLHAVKTALITKPMRGAFLCGTAGVGKTFLAEALSEIEKGEVFFFQCFPGTKEDDLLVKMLPAEENTVSGTRLYDGVIIQAMKACKEGKTVHLILDEWDKTRPSADSFLCDFLQHARVNYNGVVIQLTEEELTRFRTWLTVNDAQRISGYLRRRMPFINIPTLHPTVVRDALILTHQDNPYIPACLKLYEYSIAAGWEEPATIQELRQLLDAINYLGHENSDWNDLVLQFVSKTEERHMLLKKVEQEIKEGNINTRQYWKNEREKIDVEEYEEKDEEENFDEEEVVEETTKKMPELRTVKQFVSVTEKQEYYDGKIEEKLDVDGVLPLSELNYDKTVGVLREMYNEEPSKEEDKIGESARIVGGHILINKEFELKDTLKKDFALWDASEGELYIVEKNAPRDFLLNLRKYGIMITKYTEDEILARTRELYGTTYLRWTPEKGLEMICELKNNGGLSRLKNYNIIYQCSYCGDCNIERSKDALYATCFDDRIASGNKAVISDVLSSKCQGGILQKNRIELQKEYNVKRALEEKEKKLLGKEEEKKPLGQFDKWGCHLIKLHGISEPAILEMKYEGLSLPREGNNPVFSLRIFLPRKEELNFGSRLRIFDTPLHVMNIRGCESAPPDGEGISDFYDTSISKEDINWKEYAVLSRIYRNEEDVYYDTRKKVKGFNEEAHEIFSYGLQMIDKINQLLLERAEKERLYRELSTIPKKTTEEVQINQQLIPKIFRN